ncbi:MAG: VWA domain-containing protein [Sulfurovaceae bacterium]|nr:VWA domain-containing protein [Sulfurovaceae bacterium]
MFSFEYPWALALIFIFIICDIWCKERNDAIFFPHVSFLFLKKSNKTPILNIFKWVGISSAIIALASPVITDHQNFDIKDSKDIVFVLDAGESMRENVIDAFGSKQNRFEIAKKTINDFISKRTNDRMGLVVFGDTALIASPLTFDAELLKSILNLQEIGEAGQKTAINDAIMQSYGMLSRSDTKSKIVILLTGGIDNQSEVSKDELLSIISKYKNTLYTIGFGNKYDAAYLQELAKAGHGMAFEARNKLMLSKIYSEINKKETKMLDTKPKKHYVYLYLYPLFISWLSLLFWIYFRNVKGI